MKHFRLRYNSKEGNRYNAILFRILFLESYINEVGKLISSLLDDIDELGDDAKMIAKYKLLKNEEYNDIFYESLIISIYAFIEKQLFRLCLDLEPKFDIKVSDMSGKGIRKYKLYLSKVANIWKDSYKSDYDLLLNYNALRNYLVHSPDSRIIDSNLRNQLGSLKGLVIAEKNDSLYVEFTDSIIILELLNAAKRLLSDMALEEI